jgi:hypothetical protein
MENKEFNININDYVILDSNCFKDNYIDINNDNTNHSHYQYELNKSNTSSDTSISNDMQIFNYIDAYTDDPIFGLIINKIQSQKLILSERIKKKALEILSSILPRNSVDYKALRLLMNEGIPDEFPMIRSILWKLMLNYLPMNVNEWGSYLSEKRLDYENLKMDHIEINDEKGAFLLSEIIKDIKRTKTHMHFFSSFTGNSKDTHADVLTRILFIFAKLHPEIGYVQGMNEIVALIYYCFKYDSNPLSIECDTFYCFENFMLDVSEIYIREKDEQEGGIHFRINNINSLLETYDHELADHFKGQKVELHYFVFRWFTLFFTQEFNIPETLRIWDSLLAHNCKFSFMSYFILALLTSNRKTFLNKDFTNIMYSTQNLSLLGDIDIERLIKHVNEIKNKFSNILTKSI